MVPNPTGSYSQHNYSYFRQVWRRTSSCAMCGVLQSGGQYRVPCDDGGPRHKATMWPFPIDPREFGSFLQDLFNGYLFDKKSSLVDEIVTPRAAMETHHIHQPSEQSSNNQNLTAAKQQLIETNGGHQIRAGNDDGGEPLPEISVAWSLDPTIHSFSGSSAPTLRLFLTNHADRPITIYNEHLHLPTLLAEGNKFSIYDYTTGSEVPQVETRFCDFEPPSKIHVPLRETLFHTLPPGVPVPFPATFGRGSLTPKPNDPDDPEREQNRNKVSGVHNLEVGHHYSLRSERGWTYVRWWEYGEKDEVINPPGGKLDGRKVAYRRRKNPHPRLQVMMDGLTEIDFWCVE